MLKPFRILSSTLYDFINTLQDSYEPVVKPGVEADDSILETTIVLPEYSTIDPEVSSMVGLLNGKDSQLLNDRPHPIKQLSVKSPEICRSDLNVLNVSEKNTDQFGGDQTVAKQDQNRSEFFVHDDTEVFAFANAGGACSERCSLDPTGSVQ